MGNVRRIFVDFEFHPIHKSFADERRIAGDEIIQFGAVMLDSKGNEIGSFDSFVKPEYIVEYSSSIENLTHITYNDLEDADNFETVFKLFLDWCNSMTGSYEIYSWSDSDLIQIKNEMELKNIPDNKHIKYMIDHWNDFQKEYGEFFGFERCQSLKSAGFLTGIDEEGHAHNALYDARNTASIYKMIHSDKHRSRIESIREVLVPETKKEATLGDMIDFSSFCLS